MKMNLKQTKLVGLTMQLEEKTLEYKELCKKLEALKKQKLDPNDDQYLSLAEQFLKNNDEIKEIVFQLKELKK